jgi:hypothetical protein
MAADTPNEPTPKSTEATPPAGRSRDEVALEMMKFIAVQTGYGKGTSTGAGFQGKPTARTSEEYAEALIQLFQRCRHALAPE